MNISEFTKRVLPDVPGCPFVMAQEATLDSISQFCAQTWILIRGMGADVSVVDAGLNNQSSISMSAIVETGFRPVGIKRFVLNKIDYPLERVRVVNHVDSLTQETDFKYYYFEDNQTMVVFPMTIGSVYMEVAVAPLPSATDIDDHLYNYWLDHIVSGAKMRLFRMPGKTWSDPAAANLMFQEYSRGIVSARRQLQKSFTKQSGTVNPRSDDIWL